MNLVVLNGRLVKSPELKNGQSGTTYCNFSIAVDRMGDDKVDFVNCVAFGKTAEFITKYFTKGRKILIDGSLRQETWESNGEKRSSYKVIISNCEFGDSKPSSENKEENLRDYTNTSDNDFNSDSFPF